MPRYTVSWPPEGYRFAQDHEGRWHIERRREDGLWEDFAGPYKQRGSANERMRRLQFNALNAARRRGDTVYGAFDAIRDRLAAKEAP